MDSPHLLKQIRPTVLILLNISPPLGQIVRHLVLFHLLVESLDVPFANQAADDAHDTACNDQNATILVARLLGAKLGWSASV